MEMERGRRRWIRQRRRKGSYARDGNGMARVRRVSTLGRHILRSRDGCVRRRRSVNCRDMADQTGVHLLSNGSVDGRGVLDWVC